jgi:adenine-specific DNA-methyltransferase
MLDSETPIPASPNFEKLKAKLRELFELDKADLDFGIYRVLRQRHTEIAEFLDKHLEKTVRAALTTHGDVQSVQLKHDLEKAETAAAGAGIAPEQSPRVMELRDKLTKGADLEAIADEVYSHLLTFFSRYYQGGDFLGLHRSTVHGREKYMIPYNGEEVKLIWANMDQYYIKSSELLRDYTFRIRKADIATGELNLDDLPAESVVRFKLVEGDTEKDNRKPDGKTTRAFALDGEKPFEEDGNTLSVRFRYREHTSERNLQDKLNADTEKTLADTLPPTWKALLFSADTTHRPKDKKDSRTILQKHLRGYTAKYLFDYFIHKDLGGFLRRELDFYVKNEVMHLDDIENAAAPKAEEYLSKIRAIRRCAMPVIQMIAQLEDFQKKLWLKKKFVVETRYCLTLDRVPETLYPDICGSDAQWQEWEELVALSDLKPKRTAEFLKAHPYLMLDTRHFPREFTLKLLASIEDLDAGLNGVCFHSENFQALQLMQERYREQVKCAYFDPPYNTGNDGFPYKDSCPHSSWLAMFANRFVTSLNLLREDGHFFVSIDEIEMSRLREAIIALAGEHNYLGELVWQGSSKNDQKYVSFAHEYLLAGFRSKELVDATPERWLERKGGLDDIYAAFERIKKLHPEDYEAQTEALKEWYSSLKDSHPAKQWSHYCRAERRGIYFPDNISKPAKGYFYDVPHPTTGKACRPPKGGYRFVWETMQKELADDLIHFGSDETTVPCRKSFLRETEFSSPRSVIYQDGRAATGHIASLFGSKDAFQNPKDHNVLGRIFRYSCDKTSWFCDPFSGSGSTANAVIDLNREDKGLRKYLLVEMGVYFDTVLVPRLKKVVYSTAWKEGKPQNRNTGISHAFKIVRLESYEDTLNNLHLRRTPEQEVALIQGGETNRDQYLLGYFLDVESTGSKSLLDLAEFRDPFAYQLNIATSSAGETKETTVDLVETFNWLLGLKVKHIDHQKGFLTVTGERRAGGRCLILWRTLSPDSKADNESLDKFLTKLAVNPADTEYDFIYLNGPHTVNDPHNKVHLIEETFQRLMFDTTNFETLG